MWGVFAVYRPYWVCPSSWSVLFGSTLLRLQGGLQGHHAKLALHFVHFPGLSHSGSGTRALHKGADLVGRAFVHFPGLSRSGDQLFGRCGHCDLSLLLSLPLSFLGVQLAHFLRRMSTFQNPKKSWLAMKPACSLVDDASLGL